jgi:hypothetical protein
MRSELHSVLADIVSARIHLDAVKDRAIIEMRQGHRPTYRGHEWGRDQFDALEQVTYAVEAAFSLLKALQFPETQSSRLEDARIMLDSLDTPHQLSS